MPTRWCSLRRRRPRYAAQPQAPTLLNERQPVCAVVTRCADCTCRAPDQAGRGFCKEVCHDAARADRLVTVQHLDGRLRGLAQYRQHLKTHGNRAPGRARDARRQRLRRRRWRGAHVQRERRRGGRRVSAPERARAPHAAAGAARTQRRRQRRVQVASGQVDQLHQPPERRVQLLWGSRCAAVRLPPTACLAWQVWSACVASAATARCWPAGSHRALTLQQAGSQHTGGCPKRVWGSRASRPP